MPCSRFGKKVLMLDIELAKLPPPTPDHSAISWNAHSGQSLCCSTMPVPIAGASSIAVVRKIVLRPPARRIRNEAGMRIVAPAMPAIAVSVNSSAWRERKAQVEHLHGDDSPHAPDREAAQQRGHRDPEVAVGDALAGRFPEGVVLGAPVGDVGAVRRPAAGAPWAKWMVFMMVPPGQVRSRPAAGAAGERAAHDLGACAPRSSTSRSATPRPRRTSA